MQKNSLRACLLKILFLTAIAFSAALLFACAPPTPAPYPTLVSRAYIPSVPASNERIPTHGVGIPYEHTGLYATLIYTPEIPSFFIVDWWLDCSRWIDKAYYPMGWGGWDNRLLQCNDGRPLLMLNEPEHADQANLSPSDAAAQWYTALENWRGDVYCCGVMAQHVGYMRKIVDAYTSTYGALPARAKTHVHVYALDANGIWTKATGVDDAQRGVDALRDYLAYVDAVGLLRRGGVIISEYGSLDGDTLPADMLPVMQEFEGAFRAFERARVAGWAWFAINSDGLGTNSFSSSNLVAWEEQRTPLGDQWRSYAEEVR